MAEDKENNQTPLELTEAAGDWLDRLASNAVSSGDREAFVRWLRKSPVHVSEFLQLSALRAELSGSLARHPEWVEALLQEECANVVELGTGRALSDIAPTPRRSRVWASAAAVIGVGVMAWFGYTNLFEAPSDPNAFATTLGEQRSILLSDGSTLELNTDTEVRIRMTDDAREVDLLRGEVLVDVAKDPARPFRVLSDGVVAQAIGTRFNVYRRGDDTVVTVIEGRVAVNQSPAVPAPQTSAAGAIATIEPVELTAGLRVAIPTNAVQVVPEPANIAKATAWTERRLMFDDEPLSAIVAEFNRYNRSRLIIADTELSNRRLSGVFDANDPDEFVALISSLEQIEVQQSAEGHRTLLRVENTNSEQQLNY